MIVILTYFFDKSKEITLTDSYVHNEAMVALEWYIDNGVSDVLLNEPVDRTKTATPPPIASSIEAKPAPALLSKSDTYEQAIKLASCANTLEELKDAIAKFDGVSIKKTATNMVFAGGNPNAMIMIIGDSPVAEDDRTGTVFSGEQGALLDKMLGCIDLDRNATDKNQSVYLSNILNWRPPGNRNPSNGEIEVSLPFIERHIQLIQPEILVFLGGVTAKALLGRAESLSRLRKTWHDYLPQSKGLISGDIKPIPAIATHSLSALIKTPSQKKTAWDDLLSLQDLHKSKIKLDS